MVHYNTIKQTLWNKDIHKQCKITICEVYFKLILSCDAKTWTLKKEKLKENASDGYKILYKY
jgi:hypothetical protein